MKHRRKSTLTRRYGRASHPLFPRIHITISRNVPSDRAAAGDRFRIEAKIQPHYGAKWSTIGLRFAPQPGLARAIAHEIEGSVTAEYKPGSPVEIIL
jgi:hypothetical protein